jgi:hypothetical protein
LSVGHCLPTHPYSEAWCGGSVSSSKVRALGAASWKAFLQ